MKLYAATGACGLHVQIVLREARLPFELVLVDLATKRTADGADYRTVTPKGYIPALELDTGEVLTEGAAIAQWIAAEAPEAELMPDGFDRFRALEMVVYVATEIHKTFGPLFAPSSDEAKAEARDHIAKRLAVVEERLASHDWLAGDRFTLVDAYLFNVMMWARPAGIDLAAFPGIEAHYARVSSRPSVRAALAAEGLMKRAAA